MPAWPFGDVPAKIRGLSFASWWAMLAWPNGAIGTADQRYIYFRIDLLELVNLQKCKDSITVEIDFDNDQKTGRSIQSDKPLGVDVELVFSPPSQGGEGTAIVTYADSGKPTKRSHSVIDLMNAPTYAAKSFEVRASRRKIRQFVRGGGHK